MTHWLEVFVRRFFANQFKRSALPNGPKVTAGGTMSPRGDWRMPSDASAAAWLAEIERATMPRTHGTAPVRQQTTSAGPSHRLRHGQAGRLRAPGARGA